MAEKTARTINDMEGLFVAQLQDLYDAEQRSADILPKILEAASSTQLKEVITDHISETQQQVTRLEKTMEQLGVAISREPCEAMQGLVREAQKMIDRVHDATVKDAALIAAMQRIEHYEMAAYGTARSFADHLGHHDVAKSLQQSLNEEGHADKELNKVAEIWINVQATHA